MILLFLLYFILYELNFAQLDHMHIFYNTHTLAHTHLHTKPLIQTTDNPFKK